MKLTTAALVALVATQPLLVIEFSTTHGESELVADAKRKKLAPNLLTAVKHERICKERWEITQPIIYLLHPSIEQVYLSRNMRHAHYQIRYEDVDHFKKEVGKATRKVGKDNITIKEVKANCREFRDDFLIVLNKPDKQAMAQLNKKEIAEQLLNRKLDPTRKNICYDLGWAGTRNSSRKPKYLGITHSNLHDGSDEPWAKDTFNAATNLIDRLFPDIKDEIYNNKERNELWAGEIVPDNRIEALRVAQTDSATALLDIHWDSGNCETNQYSWVMAASWWLQPENQREMMAKTKNDVASAPQVVRHAIITYGKDCARVHMEQRRQHTPAILALERLLSELPDAQKERGSKVFKGSRHAYNFAFLDKGILYSLFATAMVLVFEEYPVLQHDLLMACAFLVNIVMSESPDHYWQICKELVCDPCALTGTPITECSAERVNRALRDEIFRRKRHSGNECPETIVAYNVHQRHAPAVNRPPSDDKCDRSLYACRDLVGELRLKGSEICNIANALHYYGKSAEYLVEECYGAGHLTAGHILGTGACMRMFPILFLDVAEMGTSTRTWKFFRWAFGYSDVNAYEETGIMMRAVSVYLGISIMQVEELCCQLCKRLAPSNADYDQSPCTINFETCFMGKQKVTGTGDVVYGEMLLYQVTEKGNLYCCDRSGIFCPAKPLLCDSLYKQITFHHDPRFWVREFKGRRMFHYKRKVGSVTRVPHLRQYFLNDHTVCEESKDGAFAPRAARVRQNAWHVRGAFIADYIARDLLGPSLERVFLDKESREPLNMKHLVWRAIHGSGPYSRRDLFSFDSMNTNLSHLVRPPCVAPKYKVIKQGAMYSCALKLPFNGDISDTNELYYPDPYFDMYATATHRGCNRAVPSDWTLYGPDDVDNGTDPRWKFDETRTEQDYHWNYSRIYSSADVRGFRRWFPSKEDAMRFALWDYFFKHLHNFDMTNPQVRSVLFKPNNVKSKFDDKRMSKRRLPVDGIVSVRVFYDSLARRPPKARIPYVIALQYPRGGSAYYFCSDTGARVSGAHLRRPSPKARRTDEPSIMYEFVGIIMHVTGNERKIKYPGVSINLKILWADRRITEEPMPTFFRDAPMEVVQYVENNHLLQVQGWKRVADMSKSLDAKKVESTDRPAVRRRGKDPEKPKNGKKQKK